MKRFSPIIFFLFLILILSGCTGTLMRGPLMRAVDNNDTQGIKTLLDEGTDLNEKSNACVWNTYLGAFSYPCTPLMHAAEMGHDEIIKLILDKGADINFKVEGYTAIEWAVANGQDHRETVLLLLDRGARKSRKPLPVQYLQDPSIWLSYCLTKGLTPMRKQETIRGGRGIGESGIHGACQYRKTLNREGAHF